MDRTIRKARGAHPFGLTWIARMEGEHRDMLMDFGVYRMKKGDVYEDNEALEKAVLLVYGEVAFEWNGEKHTQERKNCFDVPPTALHGDRNTGMKITCLTDEAEIDILRTDNPKAFGARLYLPEDTPDEFRGAGLMRETSTRIVRTIFDYTNAPDANLVLGEVIGFPGKWSSYPTPSSPAGDLLLQDQPGKRLRLRRAGRRGGQGAEQRHRVHRSRADPSPLHRAGVCPLVPVGDPSSGRAALQEPRVPRVPAGAPVGDG